MARDYTRIMTAIWSNREFLRLREAEQRLYLLLVTQEDIDASGILALRPRRWATLAADSDPKSLELTLRVLAEKRFLVIDWTTEELLVRSFIRWDGGFTNPKRKPVIIRAAEDVRSPNIARTLVGELNRVGLEGVDLPRANEPDTAPHRPSGRNPDDDGPGGGVHAENALFSQVDSLNGRQSGSEPGREPGREPANGGYKDYSSSPVDTATHNPHSGHAPSDAADDVHSLDDGFDEFWSIYPRKVKKVDARKAWRTVRRRKVPADRILAAVSAQVRAWRDADKDLEYVPYPATWLRAGSYDDQLEKPGTSVRHLRSVDGRPVQAIPDDEIDVDGLLGPDHWSPTVPAEVDEMPRDQRQAWFRARKAEHQAERIAEARAVLARRRGSA